MNAAKVLCAIDVSESARPVTAVAATLARFLHAKLELFHVLHLPPGLAPGHLSGGQDRHSTALATVRGGQIVYVAEFEGGGAGGLGCA